VLCSGLGDDKRAKNWIILTKKRTSNQVDLIHNCVELKRKTLWLKKSIHKNTEKILTIAIFVAIVFGSSYSKAIKTINISYSFQILAMRQKKRINDLRINDLFLRKKSIVRRRHLSKLRIKTKNSLMRDWRIPITFPDSESSSQ
jgi:hypothetical protein